MIAKTRYTIKVVHGQSMATAYDGYSYSAARSAVDLILAVLSMTNGTATIYWVDGLRMMPHQEVIDGHASPRIPLRTPVILTGSEAKS